MHDLGQFYLPDAFDQGIDQTSYQTALAAADPEARENLDPEDYRVYTLAEHADLADMRAYVAELRRRAQEAMKLLWQQDLLFQILLHLAKGDESVKVKAALERMKANPEQVQQDTQDIYAAQHARSLDALLNPEPEGK